ncbi:MAG: hypothetical protein J6O55_07750 [Lachnospiraceae bacterium]|nr:hypothetical protein [Lachnospiraceae bacterium]
MKLGCIICIMAFALSLTACDSAKQINGITEEQRQQIINYSSNVLSDHNANRKDTLKELTDADLKEILKRENPALAEFVPPEEKEAPKEEEEEGGGTEDSSSGEEESGTIESGSNVATMEELAGLLGLNGFSISYDGHTVTDGYPEEGSEDASAFSIRAVSGSDKLLVLHFSITNTGGADSNCDILSRNPRFRYGLDRQMGSFQTTLLLDDLATLDVPVAAGESTHAVLIAEISQEKAANMSELVLILKGDGQDTEIVLEP